MNPWIKFYFPFLLLLCITIKSDAQLNVQSVPGLPTREINDLHVDKKGYLWIAHNLGISRFDGLHYLHFSNAAQAALSMWDITEDSQGRIWCRNSSGQIFYIEGGQMKFLSGYQYEKATQVTRMAICGDELLATTDEGLFVCSTIDLTYKKILLKTTGTKSLSLASISKRAVLFDGSKWYMYSKDAGIGLLKSDTAINKSDAAAWLHPVSHGNLIFLIANPVGIVEKLWLKGDSLVMISKSSLNDFINAVSVSDQVWLHTRNSSKTIDGKWAIEGQSLTDAVRDKEGNTWFSSSKNGLLVDYKKQQWQVVNPLKDEEDFIRCLNVSDGYFFAGSNRGNLSVYDSALSTPSWETRLFDGYGSVDFIRYYKEHRFVVGTTVNTFVAHPLRKELEDLLPLAAVRDVDFDAHSLYLATPNGLYMIPYLDSVSLKDWQGLKKIQFPFLRTNVASIHPYLLAGNSSHAVRFDMQDSTLYVAFKNGLHAINKKGITPFRIGGKAVFATSLWYKNGRLFIGTTNNGLWIKKGSTLRHFTSTDILHSNTVLRIKAIGTHLWIFENESMQVLDIESESLLQNIELPKLNGANVLDVTEWQDVAYLTTAEGVYKVPMVANNEDRVPVGFLDAVIVNNRDTLQAGQRLPHYNNDLHFVFSAPAFYDPATISFRYRMKGVDGEWQTTQPGERVLRYATLPPGNYSFEAYAVNRNGLMQKDRILFEITINKPWWKEWWFYAAAFLSVLALVYWLYTDRIGQIKRVEKVRRNISSDLHDDIGATLSSINIYTELAKGGGDNRSYLFAIQQHATDVIGKLDDLIWSINPKNDSFEQLANRMRSHATELLKAKDIRFNFHYNTVLSRQKISVEAKQHIYLIYKELINNVVKHSGATHCEVQLDCKDHFLFFCVQDDGIGFTNSLVYKKGNGLPNMEERSKELRAHLKIDAAQGEGTRVQLRIPLHQKEWNIKKPFLKWLKK